MDAVLGIAYRAIAAYLVRKAGLRQVRARTGAVTLIQRFGSALNLNIHFHLVVLVLDRLRRDSLIGLSPDLYHSPGYHASPNNKNANMNALHKSLWLLVSSLASGLASASSATVYMDFDGGLTYFNETVAAAGATAVDDRWAAKMTGSTAYRAGYSVSRSNGSPLSMTGYASQYYTLHGSAPLRATSGYTVRVDPGLGAGGELNINSGLTLSFDDGINAIGFEVGDWGTCCQPSKLYLKLDDRSPILVGSSLIPGDTSTHLTNGGAGVFIAAFDDATPFHAVQFWGDGIGEQLFVGGTVHFASFPAPTPVPVPGAAWLLVPGLVSLAGFWRRRQAA